MAVDLDEVRAFVAQMRELGAVSIGIGDVHVVFDQPVRPFALASSDLLPEREPDPEAEERAALRLAYMHSEGE